MFVFQFPFFVLQLIFLSNYHFVSNSRFNLVVNIGTVTAGGRSSVLFVTELVTFCLKFSHYFLFLIQSKWHIQDLMSTLLRTEMSFYYNKRKENSICDNRTVSVDVSLTRDMTSEGRYCRHLTPKENHLYFLKVFYAQK